MKRLLTAVGLAGLLAAVPGGAEAKARRHHESKASARGCVARRPTALRFTLGADGSRGVLTWKRPKRPKAGRMSFRVLRDGAVIGQPRARRMTVRVSADRRQRLQVRAVLAHGVLSPCRATLMLNARHAAPIAPHDLVITGASETSASLAWAPGIARVGRLTGYRLFRDGKLMGTVRGRTAAVKVSANRSYRFTVAAVDSGGQTSAPSNAVTVVTGHAAPSAPQNVRVAGVADDHAGVAWDPSTASSGRIVGYRVSRDDALLSQVQGTWLTVGGLSAGRSYAIRVTATDSLGYLSQPSAPATVATTPPVASSGTLTAFLLATTGRSFADLRDHYQQVGTIHPTYFECDGSPNLAGKDDPQVTRWAQARQIKVVPRLDCQTAPRLHQILTDPAMRSGIIDQLVRRVDDHGYDGINIDFESGAPSDRDALTSFVSDLGNILHARGKSISVEVSATARAVTSGRAAFYDYAGLGQAADSVFVMVWGKHWKASAPGAISDLPWARTIADYIATMPNKDRYIYGAGLYGMDWPAGGGPSHPSTPLEWNDIQALLAQTGATPVYDPVAGAPHFSYTDSSGVGHDVWYTDARSLSAHIALARARGLRVGFWRLGEEDPSIWNDPSLQ